MAIAPLKSVYLHWCTTGLAERRIKPTMTILKEIEIEKLLVLTYRLAGHPELEQALLKLLLVLNTVMTFSSKIYCLNSLKVLCAAFATP